MRTITSISLPPDLVKAVNQYVRRRGTSMSEVARNALRDYLYRQELEDARRQFTVHAQKRGITSEADLVRALHK